MNFHWQLLYISKSFRGIRHNLKIKFNPHFLINGPLSIQHSNISTNRVNYNRRKNENSLLKSVLSKLSFINLSANKLKVTGFLLYESVADNIIYNDFFKQFTLPDTFYSWFVITELHVWMLLARTMAEGDDGRITRNSIVQALWVDVNTRVKKLGAVNPSGVRLQIDELSQQFQAALVAYDEGLLSSDKVLASALWRRFFQQKCDNPEDVELLVQYVRKQMKLLDDLSSDDLLGKRKIKWSSIKCN